MSAADFAVIGAVAGALITGITTAVISYYQRLSSARETHRIHAYEHHLAVYEQIFVAVRSLLHALNGFEAVSKRAVNSSDPVLKQMLYILNDCAHQYCTVVDWRYNTNMAYLDLRVEERCLHLRDLLLQWLSGDRVASGDVLSICRNDEFEEISARQASELRIGDYRELRIEKHIVVINCPGDARLVLNIREAATSVIKHLKDVMAF